MGTPLTSVAGIGPAAATILARHGFDSAERLAASRVEKLVAVPGFGPVRAAATLRAARALVGEVALAAADRNQDKKKKGKKGGKGNKAKRAASQGKDPGKSKSPRKGKNGDKKRAKKGEKGEKGKKAKKGKKSKGANKR
jgi:hypothetical protein